MIWTHVYIGILSPSLNQNMSATSLTGAAKSQGKYVVLPGADQTWITSENKMK